MGGLWKPPQRNDPTCTGKHTAMKAILRTSTGLMCLLLASSVSPAQERVFVSPVFKTPLGTATPGTVYYLDAYSWLIGPRYMPYQALPSHPFNGMLPGTIGQGIMDGNMYYHM